jgi:hypothetical protein
MKTNPVYYSATMDQPTTGIIQRKSYGPGENLMDPGENLMDPGENLMDPE